MRDDLSEAPRPGLAWAEHAGEACLRLTGVDVDGLGLGGDAGDGVAVLAGEVAAAVLADRRFQPAAGRFVLSAEGVDFIPRFPFVAGTAYSLTIPPCAAWPDGLLLTLRREAANEAATAVVTAVHPDVEVVPFNLLKVYLRFSEPMAEGSARRAVRVEDAQSGETLEGVFLDMDPELWDPERRRLTLLLDPGRIKRGLAPHEGAGYPLREGVAIRLVVDAGFRSAAGTPLREGFSRDYAVGPALRRPVDPGDWSIDFPGEGSPAPLRIDFDRPLDHAMLGHAFQIVDAADRVVAGAQATLPHEMGWRFRPTQAWGDGEHRLLIRGRLEDLAGNSLRRVFDRDLTAQGDVVTEAETIALPLGRRAHA